MATATITLTDDGKGAVDVALDFGDAGADEESAAHEMAVVMIRSLTGGLQDDEEGICGHG